MGTTKETHKRVKSVGVWRALVLVTDFLTLLAAVFLAMTLSSLVSEYMELEWRRFLRLLALTSIALFSSFYLNDLYNPKAYRSKMEIFGAVIKGTSLAVLFLAFLEFLLKRPEFTRSYVLFFWTLSMPLFYLERTLIFVNISPFKELDRVLIIGVPKDVKDVIDRVDHNGFSEEGYIVGVVLLENNGEKVALNYPIVERLARISGGNSWNGNGWVRKIAEAANKLDVNRVVIASPINYREFVEELHKLLARDIKIEVLPGIYEILIGKPDYRLIADIPLIQLTRREPPEWYFAVKRVMDVFISVVLAILTMPIWLLAGILVKITSPGPLLYKQRRIGKDGRPFIIYKFRTMVKDAEKGVGPTIAKENDPRITPVGRILRRYRIDELPQLWNVLKGEMSLVGPRPEREEFVRNYLKEIPFYSERLRVKPGITGLAQVWGSYSTSPEIKLIYDLIYIYNQSLLLDLEILMKTIKTVLKGSGT